MFKIIIIIAVLCWQIMSAYECSQLSQLDDSQLWQIIKPTYFQQIFNLTLGSISVLGLILSLLTWKIYPSFTIPADIMFAINIAQLIENTAIVASAAYYTANQNSLNVPEDFQAACQSIGIFFVLGNISSLVYNLVFCFVLSFSLKKTLKGSLFNQKTYHILSISIIAVVSITLSITQHIGRDLSGVCGYRIANRQSFAKFIVELLISFCCIFCMIMFRSKIPKNSYFKKVSVFGYYFYYMGIYSVIQIFNTSSYMVGNIACRAGSSYSSEIIKVSLTFASCFSVLLSYILIFLRFSHPIVRINIKKKISKEYSAQLEDELFNPNEQPWLGCLLQSIKGSQIISFISGILISFAQHEFKIFKNKKSGSYITNKNYIASLNEDITDQYILRRISNRQSVLVRQKLQGLRSLHYQFTIYAINMFAEEISKEQQLNIFKSLDINANIALIKRKSHLNGGKSGQFFFCTYDYKFILKTIKEDEAHVYLQKINQIKQYFQQHPDSLISKILGLYKFTRKDISQEPVYLILMKNISPVDRSFVQRVYDIKGSEFNRSTLKSHNASNPDKLRKVTLKDLDFRKLQGKLSIPFENSQKIKALLKRDAEFLGTMGVMDYSVLIIKRKGPPTQGKYRCEVASTRQQGIFYNIGIIDYLESWTLKRKAERAFKMMITTKKVTVTSPEQYSARLTEKLEQIL